MAAFMTHPSVRIKGTENNYEPVLCVHPKCADKPPHMHCPFCVKTETYPDPVILRAHYRVKHVDKGLDFAGLKILRCCDHCDIVGAIKGEKKFKGPHWHCYKCRNGFNRRDEAIKHYRTHFRNPQTTFQIQVAQEVNIMLNNLNSTESAEAVEHIEDHTDFGIHDAMTDGYYQTEAFVNHKSDTTSQVAANETVDAGSDAQTILLIQDRDTYTDTKDRFLVQSGQLSYEELLQQKNDLEQHVDHLEANIKLMEDSRIENERLREQNATLSRKVNELNDEIQSYRQLSDSEHTDKIDRLIDELTNDLQRNTRQILYDQLIRVKTETSHLLNLNKNAEEQSPTVQTSLLEADLLPTTTTNTDITDSPPVKKLRKCNS
ncbi:uncharacterized protein [Watersipora subatra]|uniref:uncharacterized protein n=1 Tax=Watersipora subatra TaxID=2589382 RepID=UPI00355BBADB